jgi:hypothetical protein
VIASGNALPTGRILFSGERVVFSDEGQYGAVLKANPDVDASVVISASGSKHAPILIGDLIKRRLRPHLITCSPQSPAAMMLPAERVLATRSNPEPITYNTSTYLGMILSRTRENPLKIKRHLLKAVQPRLANLAKFKAFYLLLPSEFEAVAPMFVTKFDELFGGRVTGRCYTVDQTLHAKTVIPWDEELFISFGYHNRDFGLSQCRLHIPLPADAGPAFTIAAGYYVIGNLQSQMPPWFKEHAEEYRRIQNKLFDKLEARLKKGAGTA